MENKNRIITIGGIIAISLIVVVGVTFAMFNYTKTGGNQQLIVGDIYMHYKESNTLTIENALPSDTYNPNNYFEFTIQGKNTNTKYNIVYDINLNYGDIPDGKIETNRILDKFIKFRLVEVVNNEEQEIFTNKSYSDLSSSKRIHVATIPRNTMSEITNRYRLYMWISNDVVIGNVGNDGIDYDMATWNNLFASIKVRATGNFEEKELETEASCFSTKLKVIRTLNANMTNEELQACFDYVTNTLPYKDEMDEGTTGETFCNGTGTIWGSSFQTFLDDSLFKKEDLTYFQEHNIISVEKGVEINEYDSSCGGNVVIPNTLTSLSYTLNTNMTNEEVQACVNYLTSEWGPEEEGDTVDVAETYQAFCNGTGTIWGETFQQTLNDGSWWGYDQLEYFEEHNIIIPSSDIYYVKIITSNAFKNKGLTSVVIPDSVTTIGSGAFRNNQLTSLTLGNSVTTIGYGAFFGNHLTNVVIPNSVTTIGRQAFYTGEYDYHDIDYASIIYLERIVNKTNRAFDWYGICFETGGEPMVTGIINYGTAEIFITSE